MLWETIGFLMVDLILCITSSSPHGWCKPSLDQVPGKEVSLLLVHSLEHLPAHPSPAANI